MGVPQVESANYKDAIDAILTSCQELQDTKDQNGEIIKQIGMNYKRLWWKTHNISSTTFGRFALEVENLSSKAEQCVNHMSPERALVMSKQIMAIVDSYKYSIDAESSRTRLNKDNRQPSLIDRFTNQKQERVVTLKDDASRSLKDAFLGREKRDASEGY